MGEIRKGGKIVQGFKMSNGKDQAFSAVYFDYCHFGVSLKKSQENDIKREKWNEYGVRI
jgi:hypothetical protein